MLDSLLRRLQRAGFARVRRGQHWAWAVLAVASFLLRRARQPKDPVMVSMPLEPGERYLVTLSDRGSSAGS